MSYELTREMKMIQKRDFRFSLLTSIYLLFIVLSFREYFFFLPNFSRPQTLIALTQIFTTIGWIALIVAPPTLLRKSQVMGRAKSLLFLASVLIWPLSTMTIKVLNYYYFDAPYIDYLGVHPLFILFEYVIPAVYVFMWRKSRMNKI
jgi:hypothetical protein